MTRGVGQQSVLFVCRGNTCRSPLAAALALALGRGLVAESAGISPGGKVSDCSVRVAREMIGADISDHVPRAVADVDLHSFDVVIAMDRSVGEDLAVEAEPTKLQIWDIPDPLGHPLAEYEACARQIQARCRNCTGDLRNHDGAMLVLLPEPRAHVLPRGQTPGSDR